LYEKFIENQQKDESKFVFEDEEQAIERFSLRFGEPSNCVESLINYYN